MFRNSGSISMSLSAMIAPLGFQKIPQPQGARKEKPLA
jgi:hypothetical protein